MEVSAVEKLPQEYLTNLRGESWMLHNSLTPRVSWISANSYGRCLSILQHLFIFIKKKKKAKSKPKKHYSEEFSYSPKGKKKKSNLVWEILNILPFMGCTETRSQRSPRLSRGHRCAQCRQKAAQTLSCTMLCSSFLDHISDNVSTVTDSWVAHRAYTPAIFIEYVWLDERH